MGLQSSTNVGAVAERLPSQLAIYVQLETLAALAVCRDCHLQQRQAMRSISSLLQLKVLHSAQGVYGGKICSGCVLLLGQVPRQLTQHSF